MKALSFGTPSPSPNHRTAVTRNHQLLDPARPETKTTFCVQGVMTEPCGVPSVVSIHWSSSSTPAFSHFWIRRVILRSPTRCSKNRISQSWLIVSKEATTDYPSSPYSADGNNHS